MSNKSVKSSKDAPSHPDVNGESNKVDIPDPSAKSGFAKGYEAEEILGATEMNKQILFLIKWYVFCCCCCCLYTVDVAGT